MKKLDDVSIARRKALLRELPNPTFAWENGNGKVCELIFQRAYSIDKKKWDADISGCAYRIHRRKFRDLSFMEGEVVRALPDGGEVRAHADGTRFLYFHKNIPTFDSEDRTWDGNGQTVAYRDDAGTHLIYCRHGYRIPKIQVFIGLVKSAPEFEEKLRLL